IYPVNCAEEIYILYELLVKGDYNLYFNSATILMDIGANVGYTSIFLAAQNPSVTVIGYEPVKVNYLRARRNFSLNPHLLDRVTINQFGLLNYTGDAVMQTEFDNRGRSSAVINRKLNSPGEVQELTVEVQNASDVVKQAIKEISEKTVWIKLDCEGCEYQIIESLAEARVLSQITGILFEWHVIESGLDDIVQIQDVLVANGFCVYVQRGKDKSAETGLCLATRQLE
ncbi:MAG: FkbM family methyltransferase, partial [Arenicellales bacterium]